MALYKCCIIIIITYAVVFVGGISIILMEDFEKCRVDNFLTSLRFLVYFFAR